MAVTHVPSPPRRCCQRGTRQEAKIHLVAHMLPKKKRNFLSVVLSKTCALLLNVSLEEQALCTLPFLVICYLWLTLAGFSPLRPTVLQSWECSTKLAVCCGLVIQQRFLGESGGVWSTQQPDFSAFRVVEGEKVGKHCWRPWSLGLLKPSRCVG